MEHPPAAAEHNSMSLDEAKIVLGLCADSLASLLVWDNSLSDHARKIISSVSTNLKGVHMKLYKGYTPASLLRRSHQNLNSRISGALWRCIEDYLSGKDYTLRMVWKKYFVPLEFPPMEEFTYYIQSKFVEGMTWENRREYWYITRSVRPKDRLYISITDPDCLKSWRWNTLTPTSEALARVSTLESRNKSLLGLYNRAALPLRENTDEITVQPREASY